MNFEDNITEMDDIFKQFSSITENLSIFRSQVYDIQQNIKLYNILKHKRIMQLTFIIQLDFYKLLKIL